jgi:hypothetical protein
MSKELLEKFAKKIAPYRNLWKSVRLVCLAARNGDAWVIVAVRVSFSEMLPAKSTCLRPINDFVSVSIEMPIGSLGQVLYNILVDGFVSIEIDSMPVKAYLSREHAGLSPGQVGKVSWFDVVTHERQDNVPDYGTTRPAITLTAWGERRYDVLNNDLLRELNSKLRIGDPPYDGLTALLSEWMPGVDSAHESQSPIQLVAPVPFDMEYADHGLLLVRGPADRDLNLQVRMFYRPGGTGRLRLAESSIHSDISVPGITAWEAPISWPKDSLGAKIVLFLDEHEVDSFEVTRWPHSATLLAAINVFFDPEHKRLREALLGRKQSKDGFEFGVVRLLNLLGVPAIWYGKGTTQARPDLAALIADKTARLVVLGECTRERPDAKFSGLAERAKELHEYLSDEVGILPIVFTSAQTTESEIQKAVEHNVSLIGREELTMLLEYLESGRNRSEVLNFLQTMRLANSIGVYKVGLMPRR